MRTVNETLQRAADAREDRIDLSQFDNDPVLAKAEFEDAAFSVWVARVCMHLAPDRADRYLSIFADYEDVFDELLQHHRVLRLSSILQFGVKTNALVRLVRKRMNHFTDVTIATTPHLLTRYAHSKQVGAHAGALAICAGLSDRHVLCAMVAGLLHDIGYGALSHDGDSWVVRQGFKNHEERGRETILVLICLQMILKRFPFTLDELIVCLKELPPVGPCLKFGDTFAYTQHDLRMAMDETADPLLIRKIFQSVVGLEGDRLITEKPGALQIVLELRAALSQHFYYAQESKIAAGACDVVLTELSRRGHIRPSNIAEWTDGELKWRLTHLFNTRRYPEGLVRAYDLMNGCFEEVSHYHRSVCSDRVDLERALARVPRDQLPFCLVLYPYDFTRKRIRVQTTDGRIKNLSCGITQLEEKDTTYQLYMPRRP